MAKETIIQFLVKTMEFKEILIAYKGFSIMLKETGIICMEM
jgi:hypothetical protein